MIGHEWIARIQAVAPQIAERDIHSLAIGGSIGHGEADVHSDVDLFLLTSEQQLSRVCESGIREIAELLGPCSLFRGPVFVEGFGYSFTALAPSDVILQFNLNTPAMLKPNPMAGLGHVIIFDRDDVWRKFAERSALAKTDWAERFQISATFFWLRAISASKCILRGQLWMARRYLGDLSDQMLLLQRLKSDRPPLNLAAPAKWIERDLGDEVALDMLPAGASNSDKAVLSALRNAVSWYASESARFVEERGYDDHVTHEGQRIARTISGVDHAGFGVSND
jgi:hypothetical protein